MWKRVWWKGTFPQEPSLVRAFFILKEGILQREKKCFLTSSTKNNEKKRLRWNFLEKRKPPRKSIRSILLMQEVQTSISSSRSWFSTQAFSFSPIIYCIRRWAWRRNTQTELSLRNPKQEYKNAQLPEIVINGVGLISWLASTIEIASRKLHIPCLQLMVTSDNRRLPYPAFVEKGQPQTSLHVNLGGNYLCLLTVRLASQDYFFCGGGQVLQKCPLQGDKSFMRSLEEVERAVPGRTLAQTLNLANSPPMDLLNTLYETLVLMALVLTHDTEIFFAKGITELSSQQGESSKWSQGPILYLSVLGPAHTGMRPPAETLTAAAQAWDVAPSRWVLSFKTF